MIRAVAAVAGAVLLGVFLSGCDCSGDLCIEVSRSFHSREPCIGAPMEQCVYANVFFTATSNGQSVTDPTTLSAKMKINDRDVGVEGGNQLTTSNGMIVQLLLDRSYSITESNSTNAVRDAAAAFISKLPMSSRISLSVFASESDVPQFLSDTGEKTSTQQFFDRAVAATIVKSYDSYPAATSTSQTKLYDAVEALGAEKPTGEGVDLLQHVLVVFTDGADTASTQYRAPAEVVNKLAELVPSLKIYAIGLGPEPNQEALNTLSNKKFFRAADANQLQASFDAVAKELTAIYRFKVLVAQAESEAKAVLTVKHGNSTVVTSFDMSSTIESAPPFTPVTSSSSQEDGSWGRSKVVDGNKSSLGGPKGWSSNSSTAVDHTEWIALNLGAPKMISRVDVYPRDDFPGAGYPVDFTVQVSGDYVHWTTVATKTSEPQPLAGVQSYSFPAQSAQYVMIEGTRLRPIASDGNRYRMQFAEIEVH